MSACIGVCSPAIAAEWQLVERWAGHQVVLGSQTFTLVGEVDTRTDSFVIADVRRRGDRYRLTQYTCRVEIAPVAGVKAELADAAARALPPATIEFSKGGDGAISPASWTTVWDTIDHDNDGHPGVSVSIDAPLCGGSLYISTVTRTNAQFVPNADAVEGSVDVRVNQNIIDTSNWCLDLATSDSVEEVEGRVRYTPTSQDATCDRLFATGWPVFVSEESLTTASSYSADQSN